MLGKDGGLDLYPEVTGKNYLRAHLVGSSLQLTAGNHIGLIPLNDRLAITVNPRVDIARLTHLLRVSRREPVSLAKLSRHYEAYREQVESIVDTLAAGFVSAADELLRRGLMHEYAQRREATSFPRGRLDIGATMRTNARGMEHRVHATWFESTVDTPANRLLKYTLRSLAAQYQGQQRRRGHVAMLSDLNRLYRGFDRVELVDRRDALGAEVASTYAEPWGHYEAPIAIAQMLLRDQGVDLGIANAGVTLHSLLVNMEDVFEDYLRVILQQRLRTTRPAVVVANGNLQAPAGARRPLFTDTAGTEATPDIVVTSGLRTVVVEVKYKSKWTRDDLNQVITYGLSFGAEHVVIMHLGTDRTSRSLGTIGGIGVHSCDVDLSADLDAEEVRLSTFITALLDA
jgi:5-methylcytosine-specific restriction enzyme subunit McrC